MNFDPLPHQSGSMDFITRDKLDCGLTVIHIARPGTKTFCASLAYGTGSFHDPTEMQGATHFCEHLAFRGSSVQVWHDLSELGVYVNAQTPFDHTLFSIEGHVDHFQKAVQLLRSILQCTPCSQEEFLAEKQILLHELSEIANTSARESMLSSHSRKALGDPNWHLNEAAQLKSFRQTTQEQLEAFRQDVFAISKAVLVVASPWESESAMQLFEEQLGNQLDRQLRDEYVMFPEAQIQSQIALKSDRWPYVWLDLTHIAPRCDHLTRLTAEILGRVLGGGLHGLVTYKLRHERSLAYNVRVNRISNLRRAGLNCFASVPHSAVMDAIEVILGCHEQIACDGISAEQLQGAKQRLIRWYELGMDHPRGLVEYLACEGLRGDDAWLDPATFLREISELELDEVHATAATLLSPENRYLFAGGRLGWLLRWKVRRKFQKALSA